MEVSEILEAVDIVDYIGQYCELEERSDGEYWGCSPFTEENTPSFSVNPNIGSGVFCDFSSGKSGNLISFVMAIDQCSMYSAVEKIRKYAGIVEEVGEIGLQKYANRKPVAIKTIKKFRKSYKKTKPPEYRRLENNYMERFEHDTKKLQIWRDEGISDDVMKKFGVMYDRVADRIVFPIRSMDGSIVSVCGRTLDPDYKQKKLRKYTYYTSLGTLDLIYGIYENMRSIIEKREVILFEGAKSVMLADVFGWHNTGAILTSHLNENQMKVLIKLGCRVVFALDEDVDILKDENIQKLCRYVRVDFLKDTDGLLSEKMSPVDAGQEVFEELYKRRFRLN